MGKAAYRRVFRYELFTPEGSAGSDEAISATFPALDGQVGVLGGRGPMVSLLGAGPLTIETLDGQRREYFVSGGFAQVRDGLLTVLAEQCLPVDQIDLEAAWAELQEALKLPTQTDRERAWRDEAVAAARKKFNLTQKRRRRGWEQRPAP